jgi:hypothetical protein
MKNNVLTSCAPDALESNNVTHRSQQMQKYKFSVTCPNAFFMETALSPPRNEK